MTMAGPPTRGGSRRAFRTFLLLITALASHAALASAQASDTSAPSQSAALASPTSGTLLSSKNSSCQESPSAYYDCVLDVAPGRYALHWALDDGVLYVMAVANTTGWVAVGWSATGQMVNSDAIIGPVPAPGGGLTVQAFRLEAKSVDRVIPNKNVTVSYATALTVDGMTQLAFARLVNESGPGIVPVVAANGVPNRMLWAMSPDDSTTLQYHGPTSRCVVKRVAFICLRMLPTKIRLS